ncbi:hypothetical protein DITRI_Ditri05aG0049400 [Diplodiscus trichospermus]
MPGRGGGRDRRQESGRAQPSPFFCRVGDATGPSGPPPQVAPTQPPAPSAPATSTSPYHPSSSSGAESLRREVTQKLALEPQVATTAPPLPPSSSKVIRFPSRPGLGTVGRKCRVRANHFLVDIADNDLHHYDVCITPETISKNLNRSIMEQLIKSYKESLGRRCPAYDGRKSLYTAGALPFDSKEFVVKLIDEDHNHGSSTSARKERQYKVAINLASKPDPCPQETIQALDVVLRAKPSENYTVVGRSFFSPKLGHTGELGNGIEYWKGFYQSLRPILMGLSLNIDVSARSFYEPVLVTKFVAKHLKDADLSMPMSDQDRIKVKKALKGVKVELSHMEYAKTYKISGLSREPISQLTFTLDENRRNMSMVQYFHEKYKIKLKYASLPALQCGSEARPVYLPMELSRIVGGQTYTKKLNKQQVQALLRATCQRPHDRKESIKMMIMANNFQGDAFVEEFGIQVQEELALVDARVLPPPILKYHDSGQEQSVNPGFGAWNMINKKMVNGGKVDFWTCVNFSREYANMSECLCTELVKMCNSKGMEFCQTASIPIHSAGADRIDQALSDIGKKFAGMESSLQLLIIILPDQTGSYGKIKRICETQLGIVSQCCQPKQVARKTYLENLALKINVKVGGRNTVLYDAIMKSIPLVSDIPTIIFGADVTHPQPGEDSSSSIAAVVASMDWPEVTKYRGIVSAQPPRKEIIQDLYKTVQDPQKGVVHGGMIRELLLAFFKSTRQKPSRIIFYRDGVGEGQFSQVLLYEMDTIRKACASLEEGYMPPVKFVVVQKRHHTRLFPTEDDQIQTDRSGNIRAGTVVDTSICHPTEFDFYLKSHAGIKKKFTNFLMEGTSKPTHYHVLFDENNFTADIMQVLTNNLCYTYARCTKSVSIVPPAYYAHLIAFRARYYIEDQSSDNGSTSGGEKAKNKIFEVLPDIKDNVKEVMFYC